MLKRIIGISFILCGFSAHAEIFKFTITNGSNMPLAPGVLYTSSRAEAESHIGAATTQGFVTLCQTGMNDARTAELEQNPSVIGVTKTAGPLLPGVTRTFEIDVKSKRVQAIHFEAMYGKTKDTCAVISVNRHNLLALRSGVVATVSGKDQVVVTGAFSAPSIDNNTGSLCAHAPTAVDCLRLLSTAKTGTQKIRAFAGYLPSVLTYLENQYGADDTQTLLVPSAGAIRFRAYLGK